MNTSLQVQFCGIQLENPCLLSSASPTQSKEGIAKAFKLGWTVPKLVAREQLNMNWAVRSTVVAPEACVQCAKCMVACQESGKAAICFVNQKVTIGSVAMAVLFALMYALAGCWRCARGFA